jgi:ribosomal protein S18 acetylase RimI-like enzyme
VAQIQIVDAAGAAELTPALTQVYAAAFAEPPYGRDAGESERFANVFATHRSRNGFVLAAAQDAGTVVGFTYGYLGRAGEWWHDRVAAAIDPRAHDPWLTPGHLEIVELAVSPSHRRRGIGGQLLDALLEAGGAPTAVLSSRIDAPALEFYLRRGWRRIGELRFSEGGPVYAVLAFDARPGR